MQRLFPRLGILLVWATALHLVAFAQRDPTAEPDAPIRLRGMTFRPSRGERPVVPPALRAQTPTNRRGYYLVQFRGPVLETWTQALTAVGAEVIEYVPEFAFKVRMTRDQATTVSRLAPVVLVDDFHPFYKLGGLAARSEAQRPYLVRAERGADATAVAREIDAAGARVLTRSGSTMTVVADASRLDAIARVLDVASISDFELRRKHSEYAGGVIMGADAAHAAGFDGSSQIIGIADSGLGGGTLVSAHVDLQPPRLSAMFNWPGVAGGCFTSVLNDGAIDVDTGHGTHTTLAAAGAGGPAGQGRGTAPAAGVVFQAVENWAVPSALCSLLYGIGPGYFLIGLPGDLHPLFQQAYDAGARIHSDSWGGDASGSYTSDSAEVDDFVWNHRDMTITFSAGNAGTDVNADGLVDSGSLAAPASAKNTIAVGASENDRQSRWDCDPSLSYTDCAANGGQNSLFTYGATWPSRFPAPPISTDVSAGNADQMAAFSSRGPAADGRIKPDVVAPGTWVLSGYSDNFQQQYDSAPNPQNGLYQYDGWGSPLNAHYKYMGGTSMANPLVAGAAAVVRDFYQKSAQHEASAALVKATLVNSAVDLVDENNDGINDNRYPIPNGHEGWGRVNVAAAVDGRRQFVDNGSGLTTNGSWATAYAVGTGRPFKVTLAWSDYPSSTTAAKNLVNDLDLRITGPNGVTYFGNAFANGWSEAGGAADRLNNLENVFVPAPEPGAWIVEVVGYNVPFGPQPFALAVDGDIDGAPSPLPAVTVAATGGVAREAGIVTGAFTVARTGATSAPLTVRYSMAGTATAGVDYLPLQGSITIPAGSATVDVAVTPIDDADVENDESVLLTLVPDPAYAVGTPASAGVAIVSNDAYPDLIVSALTAPARGAAGDTVVVTDTTKNQGVGPAVASVTRFYLSANLWLEDTDLVLGSRAVPVLASGISDLASTSLTIPTAAANGTYYVLARADGALAIPESVETNNVKFSGQVQVGGDLSVTAIASTATAGAGASVVVTDSTANVGTASVPASVTRFYLSTNLSVDAADVALGSRAVAALGVGELDTASTHLALPATIATGTYYVLGQADAAGMVAEASELNNVRYSGALKIGPDLIVGAMTVPSAASAGGIVVVTDTTQNAGGGNVPASTTVFYLSANVLLDAADMLLGSRVVSALAAGAGESASTTLAIPSMLPTGTYYVLAQADGLGSLAETTEINNGRLAGPVQIGPDLVVSAVTGPATAGAGSSLAVSETTRNQGSGTAPASVTTFYLSLNLSIDATDIALGSRGVPALSPGSSDSAVAALVIPQDTPTGAYYVIASADGSNVVAETVETNNTRFSSAVRVGPDLVVSALSVPIAVVAAGSTVIITETTMNQGSGGAGTSATAFYLSINTLVDGTDILLGTRTVTTLGASASEARSTTVTIPATLAPGTYYVLVQADADGAVSETIETNNGRLGWVRVGPR